MPFEDNRSSARPNRANIPVKAKVLSAAAPRIRLPHSVIVRSPGLLPMLYAPTEIAEELDVLARTVRDWLTQGLPHERDARGRIWIDGRKLADWVTMTRPLRTRQPMGADEAYCLKCRKPAKLLNPVSSFRGKQELSSGICPTCGSSIHRGSRNG